MRNYMYALYLSFWKLCVSVAFIVIVFTTCAASVREALTDDAVLCTEGVSLVEPYADIIGDAAHVVMDGDFDGRIVRKLCKKMKKKAHRVSAEMESQAVEALVGIAGL